MKNLPNSESLKNNIEIIANMATDNNPLIDVTEIINNIIIKKRMPDLDCVRSIPNNINNNIE